MVDEMPRVVFHRGRVVLHDGSSVEPHKADEHLKKVFERYGKALIEDLDGIERNRPNWALVKKLGGKDAWVDAGVRTADGIYELFVAGAGRAVLSSECLRGLGQLEKALDLSDKIVFRAVLGDKGLDVIGRFFGMGLGTLLEELGKRGGTDVLITGADRLELSPATVEGVLALDLAGLEVRLAVPAGFDGNALDAKGIKGAVIGRAEV